MPTIPATQIRRGTLLQMPDGVYLVQECEHRTPGNLRAFVQVKLKNLATGSTLEKRLRADDKFETAYLETKPFEYLFRAGEKLTFMDLETYEQIEVQADELSESLPFLRLNEQVKLVLHDGHPISVDLPTSVVLRITETEPAVRGNSATNIFKSAKCETGLQIKVPLFVNIGESVRIDTRSGEFLSREAATS